MTKLYRIVIDNYVYPDDKKDLYTLRGIATYYLDQTEWRATVTGVTLILDSEDKIIDSIVSECKSCGLRIKVN